MADSIKVLPVLKGAQPQIAVPLPEPRAAARGASKDAHGAGMTAL